MTKLPNPLRETIAANIRRLRGELFPGKSGCKHCAKTLNVSAHHWLGWENGICTPNQENLKAIAALLQTSVGHLRRDNRHLEQPEPVLSAAPAPAPAADGTDRSTPPSSSGFWNDRAALSRLSMPELLMAMERDQMKAVYRVEVSVSLDGFQNSFSRK